MRKAFSKAMIALAEADERIILMTGDLGFMVLEEFQQKFPSRFFNVGVAEANMVGLATGLASCGYIPYCYSIATFASMRPYEQLRNGPILHNLPVRIVGVGGGYEYGSGGFTHHALEDLAITRVQPGLGVIAPADPLQAEKAIRETYDMAGPIYFRIGKNDNYKIPNLDGRFKLGRCETVREGPDLLIVSLGSITVEAVAAAERLSEEGIEPTVTVVSSLRPAPVKDLAELLSRFKLAVTVEEHYLDGGLGSLVAEVEAEQNSGCRIMRCGVKRKPTGICGSEEFLRDANDLSCEVLTQTILRKLEKL
jgi:transketolase